MTLEALTAPEGATFERRSPVTGEVATVATAATVAQALAAADAAAAAFPAWSRTGPARRRELLNRAADLLQERADAFVRCMVEETGTSAGWAQFNVRGGIGALREAAALTTHVSGDTIPSDLPGCMAMTFRVPVGVVFGMAPWNAPLLLGLRAIVAPLACGNTVVLKASEHCPGSHWMIGRLFADAGFAQGVVNVVTHDAPEAAAIVEALIEHAAVRRVNFTGSTRVGRIIGAIAGRALKPCLLELGGKSPLVVLRDADIELAVNAAAFGAFMNQGQICMSTERVVVEEDIADRFAEALAAKAKALGAATAGKPAVLFESLISCPAADQVEAMVRDAQERGARVLVPLQREGARMGPVVLDHVRPGMRVYDDESFGPIAAIVRVADLEEAVRVANDTEYGLAGAVFGRDISRTLEVAQRLECGVCHVNGPTVKSEPQLPFGGVKSSGYGRFGGRAAIQEFTELRSVTIQVAPQAYPF
ncbi:aldehyde dehydrogenase [Ramlibacter sp. AN1015]|uniref:aldehyde dehydrogenase n=1 Tax=Ramlibacter sp. AN1015 TaxID=3133428 RepID=UPI0030C55622